VLADALASVEPHVIAAAGGVVLAAGNRRLLRSAGTVVWLQAPVVVLVDRVATGHHRPAVEDDPEASLTRMEHARAELYAEVADVVIDTTLPLTEVVTEVLGVVERREAAA
jgi:shikimate kinase